MFVSKEISRDPSSGVANLDTTRQWNGDSSGAGARRCNGGVLGR